MIKYLLVLLLLSVISCLSAQPKVSSEKNLRSNWIKYEDGKFEYLGQENSLINTLYLKIETNQFSGGLLSIQSARPFFIFFNGQVAGEYEGKKLFNLDSLTRIHYTPSFIVAIHQKDINPRDLKTAIIVPVREASTLVSPLKPVTYFRDFVILSGLIVILLFLLIIRLNPKLTSDYFSVIRIFSLREGEDAQSNARLASSSNLQFYIICSLLLGFYMMIVIHHLPDEYILPLYFKGSTFWTTVWQWIRISTVILSIFFIKILLVFSLTRLFGLKGLARIHFFNWVRLLFIVFGGSSIILFVYYILRGQSPVFFISFLTLVVGTLTVWVFIAFLKLNGKTEHSMFHLFSYICATEIIPLLITIKVLFQ
jgi:hypothetical protein